MMELGPQDYKYVIEDFSSVYIGARLSYRELAEHDTTPTRLKDCIYRVFFKEVDPDMSIAEHIRHMDKDSVSYQAFSQLNALIKVTWKVTYKNHKGEELTKYNTRDFSFADFYSYPEFLRDENYLIQEVNFLKRRLLMMHV